MAYSSVVVMGFRMELINRLQVLWPCCCQVCTWMNDHLWAGKHPRNVTSLLGQLSLTSLQDR